MCIILSSLQKWNVIFNFEQYTLLLWNQIKIVINGKHLIITISDFGQIYSVKRTILLNYLSQIYSVKRTILLNYLFNFFSIF